LSPPNNPVRIIERPPGIEPENGHASPIGASDSKRIEWMRLLWEKRRFLGRATILGFVLSVIIVVLLPVRYESKTRLMPPDQQSGSGLAMIAALAGRGASGGTSSGGGMAGALGGSLGSVAGDLLGLKSSGALFVDMIDGPTIQDDLIRKFDLRNIYHDRYWEQARKDLGKRTTVKEDRKSGVISITVSDHDPHRAQEMAQAYVDALNGLVAQVSTSSARRERMFVEGRLKTVRQNLDDALQAFSEYASKNGTFDIPSQTKAMVESEATLQGQLVAAQSELEGLKQIYTDNNIRVRSLEARVGALKHQVENMSGNKADLNSNDSGITGDFPSIRKLPLVGVRWANLYRESKIQETVYEMLTQEYEIAKIQEAKEIPSVNVLDPPLVPERKSFPPRTLLTLLGTIFAFCVGATVAIGAEAWRQNRSPGKQLATEIWAEIMASRSRTGVLAHRAWGTLNRRNGASHRKIG
jgi:capsule polysaccharide export protein KpsE/RkpR